MVQIIQWDFNAWEDYLYWQNHDKKNLERINKIIKDIIRNPFDDIGKPEPLKNNLSGLWSRRIDNEHRIVYTIENDVIIIFSCCGHYDY